MKSEFIRKEIEAQKKRKVIDHAYISMIESLEHKDITIDIFRNTGRIMPVSRYLQNHKDDDNVPIIKYDTLDVIRYAGGFVIQCRPENKWMIDEHTEVSPNESQEDNIIEFDDLKEAEEHLWRTKVRRIFS